ncbi:hypothetical protein BR93DRAFT_961407 [Coniochaeta sp. PMI_546]|nr:hypothetical protein BR93DRAFT_961407 [Coniochaeta sp. PMI_546]
MAQSRTFNGATLLLLLLPALARSVTSSSTLDMSNPADRHCSRFLGLIDRVRGKLYKGHTVGPLKAGSCPEGEPGTSCRQHLASNHGDAVALRIGCLERDKTSHRQAKVLFQIRRFSPSHPAAGSVTLFMAHHLVLHVRVLP